jgi:Domain of unknown function (DUF1735)
MFKRKETLIFLHQKYFGFLNNLKTIKNIHMKYISRLLPITAALFLTSCLKDSDGYKDLSEQSGRINGENKIIEMRLTAESANNFLLQSFDATSTDTIINIIPVQLATPFNATEDITVTLTMNNTLISDYNTANGTAYDPAPTNLYTIQNNSKAVIKAGTRTAYLTAKLKPSDFLGHDYAFGYEITAIDKPGYLISGNIKKGVFAVIINRFDGGYSLRIRQTGWAAYGINDGGTFDYPKVNGVSIGFVTAGANSFDTEVYNGFGDLNPGFTPTGGATAFGATTPRFTLDNSNRLVNVQNTTPDDGRGRTLFVNPAVTDSRYDPLTRTLYAAFVMTQNGRPNQFFYDTMTFIKAR